MKNINLFSIEQLKALAYDHIAFLETAQKELQTINSLIQQKSMDPETPIVTPEEIPVETAPESAPETTEATETAA